MLGISVFARPGDLAVRLAVEGLEAGTEETVSQEEMARQIGVTEIKSDTERPRYRARLGDEAHCNGSLCGRREKNPAAVAAGQSEIALSASILTTRLDLIAPFGRRKSSIRLGMFGQRRFCFPAMNAAATRAAGGRGAAPHRS